MSTSPRSQSKASSDRRYSSMTLLEQSVDRIRAFINIVALAFACTLILSSPFTMTNFFDSSRMPSTIFSGLRLVGLRRLSLKIFCAFQISLCRLQGSTILESPLGKVFRTRARSSISSFHSFSSSSKAWVLPIRSLMVSSVRHRRSHLRGKYSKYLTYFYITTVIHCVI